MSTRRWLAALAIVLLASCAYVDATTTQYVGVPRFPASDPAAVQVLLREEAAKMGGNAVFVVRDMVNPNVGRKLIAVAIRYRQ